MLYTRFVIGEDTLSSTSVFSFCHWAIFSRLIKSFIWVLLLGIIGSYVMSTLPLKEGEHQAENVSGHAVD